MKMEWKGHTTAAMETMNTEEVDSPLMASGIQLLHLPQCHLVL